jgi:hypothetical protein
MQDRHRESDAICVLPRWRKGRAHLELVKETGWQAAIPGAEKTLQRDAGISNIVLA